MKNFKTSLLIATAIASATASGAFAQTFVTPAPNTSGTVATPGPITAQSYVTDASVANVSQGTTPATPTLANNPFAIQAPGNPASYVLNTGGAAPVITAYDGNGNAIIPPSTNYTVFDGDYAVHGAGATSVANVLTRVMNCFGTPNPLGNGQGGAVSSSQVIGALAFTGFDGSFATTAVPSSVTGFAESYNGTPALLCNNGTFQSAATAGAAVTAASSAAATGLSATNTTGVIDYGVINSAYGKASTNHLWFVPGNNVQELQPQFADNSVSTGNQAVFGFSGKYIEAGSGYGQRAWSLGGDVFDDGFAVQNSLPGATAGIPNPYSSILNQGLWSHVQFAFSDAPLYHDTNTSNFQDGTYNANAATKGGPAVQIPLFVIPVAIAYNNYYAQKGTTLYQFNVKGKATYPTTINGGSVNSMQLTGSIYCGIFNGMITNWNDPALTQANKNIPLYDTTNDNATRWNKYGAPIRLVGRLDNSGTTDVFTRHLAYVCNQPKIYGFDTNTGDNYFTSGLAAPLLPVSDKKNFVGNKFAQHGQALPYNASATSPVYTAVRTDTPYDGVAANSANYAGTSNVVSGEYFTGTAISSAHVTGGASSVPNGYNGSGLFLVASGGGNVAKAINYYPDYNPAGSGTGIALENNNPLIAANSTTLLFNGKIGYISADVVTGADATVTQAKSESTANPYVGSIHAAILATVPNSYTAVGGIYAYTYYAPTAKNAQAAFNTYNGTTTGGALAFLPPESDASGNYVAATTPVVDSVNPSGNLVRSNPLAWPDMFYQQGAAYTAGGLLPEYQNLAMPSQGYPITGTTQMLTYTCFTSAGNRQAIADLLATLTSQLTVDSTNTKINKTAFTSTSASTPGILAGSSFSVVPSAWQVAIARTFLSSTSDVNAGSTSPYTPQYSATTSAYTSGTPLYFTTSIVPTKTKVSAGVYAYTPTTNNPIVCNSEGNTAQNGAAAGTNTGL